MSSCSNILERKGRLLEQSLRFFDAQAPDKEVRLGSRLPVKIDKRAREAAEVREVHQLLQADYALGYREDRPLRCEPWPAQGFERGVERILINILIF